MVVPILEAQILDFLQDHGVVFVQAYFVGVHQMEIVYVIITVMHGYNKCIYISDIKYLVVELFSLFQSWKFSKWKDLEIL